MKVKVFFNYEVWDSGMCVVIVECVEVIRVLYFRYNLNPSTFHDSCIKKITFLLLLTYSFSNSF